MLKIRRLPSYLPFIILMLILILSFVVYYVGLGMEEAPPGCDYGNYLTQVEILRGNDMRGWGLQHNPVFFLILDIFLRFFEEITALKIVAALVFSVISIPFFLFARKLSNNQFSALICTWLFVFFISNSEMIQWGGNPNILGFSFMLLTLFFFIDLMKEPSKKNLLLSGLFFSLVIGTHTLVSIYLLFSIFIFFILMTCAEREINKVRIKSLFLMIFVTLFFSLPYVSFYLNFFSKSSDDMVKSSVLSIQLPQISIESILEISQYWDYFVVAVIFTLGILALSKYIRKEHKSNGLLLLSLLLSPLLLALVTEQFIRWVYFLPIPLILCFSIYLREMFFIARSLSKSIYLLAIFFIAIICVYSTMMSINHLYHLPNEIDRPALYQFIYNDEMQTFRWIKKNIASDAILATSGHPKGDIGGGGNSYSWWVEGYCKRVCVASGDLNYYSYQNQRDEVRTANRIFSGSYSMEYENIRVTESYPSYTTNPEIAVYINNDYQRILALNDKEHQLFFSPNENEQELSDPAPFYSENSTSTIKYGKTWANITITYEQKNFELIRSVILGEEKSSVDIVFQILPKNVKLRLFKINLWSLFDTKLEEVGYPPDSYDFILSKVHSNGSSQTQISILDTNGNVTNADVLFEDPRGSTPTVSYSFEPLQNNLRVQIGILLEPSSNDKENTEELGFYDSYNLINDLDIDYILLNQYRDIQFDRFLADTEHFDEESVYGSNHIFRVIK